MKTIPFTRPSIDKRERWEMLRTLSSDWLTSGVKVLTLEKMLSDYIGCKFVKILNSCTSSLDLAILSCEIKKGDEVITTPLTFCATVNTIIHSGAKPIFADIDKNTFNIDPQEIERKVTKKTKAILIMHHGGLACDMNKIGAVARKYKLKVIEDAAHAIGAEYKGKKIGSISDTTCFSFHAAKNMTTGEGGAITTNRKSVREFIKKSYFHGIDKESWQRHKKGSWQYRVIYPGFKYNMSDILASLGIQQLKKLDRFIEKRRKIAHAYDKAFKDNNYIKLQNASYDIKHAHHLYPIVLNTGCLNINRGQFIERLKEKGIMTSVHFIPIYKHPAYKMFFTKNDVKELSNTEYIYNRIISLPIYPRLSLEDARRVASTVEKLVKKTRR